MNTNNIRRLADVIEQQPHTTVSALSGFTMSNWTHDCGTPACIAGWANYVRAGDEGATHGSFWSGWAARRWLELDEITGYALFRPDVDYHWDDITPAHAAAVLRHLADTGEVDWSVGT